MRHYNELQTDPKIKFSFDLNELEMCLAIFHTITTIFIALTRLLLNIYRSLGIEYTMLRGS